MSEVVRARGLRRRFEVPGAWPWSPARLVTALDGVDLDVAAGEVVALVGRSGSGKTTLARVLLGLEEPDGGEVHLEGVRWDHLPERTRRARRPRYQYVPQDAMSALDPQQTVREHVVETLAVLAAVPRAEQGREADVLLGRLGLKHRADALPRELSGGEQRRVTLARVLALRPRLVVADEPTSGLDPDRRAQVLGDLLGNLEADASCVLVTHDLDAVEEVAHRVIVLHEGRVIETWTPRAGRPAHALTRALLDPWQTRGAS